MIYTTLKDFELFKKECKCWIDRLGLYEWEYTFLHHNIKANADCTSFRVAKNIVLRLAKEIEKLDLTKIESIKLYARHEVFHALLEGLYHQAIDRGYCEEDYRIEEHVVINHLQKAFKEIK